MQPFDTECLFDLILKMAPLSQYSTLLNLILWRDQIEIEMLKEVLTHWNWHYKSSHEGKLTVTLDGSRRLIICPCNT